MANHRNIIVRLAPILSGIKTEISSKNFSYLSSKIMEYANGALSGEAILELLKQFKSMSGEQWYEDAIDKIISIVRKEEEQA